MIVRGRVSALVGAALLVIVLAGCAPATHPVHTTTPSAASTPTPTPTPAYLTQPASRYTVGCDALFPEADLTTLFSHSMSSADGPAEAHSLVEANEVDGVQVQDYYLRDVGGLSCAWTDGESTDTAAAQYLTVEAAPESADWYAKWAAATNDGNGQGDSVDCNGIGYGTLANFCLFAGYRNGSVVILQMTGLKANPGNLPKALPAPVQSLVNSVFANLSTVRPITPPPSGSITLPTANTWMLTPTQLQQSLGVGVTMGTTCDTSEDGGLSLGEATEVDLIGSVGCAFTHSSGTDNARYGSVDWMPGGEWAANGAMAATPNETILNVPGLAAGDSARMVIAQAPSNGSAMDLLIGGNWIYVYLDGASGVGGVAADAPKATTTNAFISIAQDLEKNIRG